MTRRLAVVLMLVGGGFVPAAAEEECRPTNDPLNFERELVNCADELGQREPDACTVTDTVDQQRGCLQLRLGQLDKVCADAGMGISDEYIEGNWQGLWKWANAVGLANQISLPVSCSR